MPDYPLSPEEFAPLSPEEFIANVKTNKIVEVDALIAWLLYTGKKSAEAEDAYYRVWLKDKSDERIPDLRANKERLAVLVKILEHSISGLQSTLKADNEMQKDFSADR